MPAVRPRPPARHVGVALFGAINGSNTTFTTPVDFLNAGGDTIAVFYNGQRLFAGAGNDYLLSESGGPGTGWDTVTVLFVPRLSDRLTADFFTP